jgi:hypothetical protein
MKKLRTTILTGCCIFWLCVSSGCAEVRVKTHYGWMGPDTWEATDGKVSVNYYNGDCCCIAKEVLQSLADQANSGAFNWVMMDDQRFREETLSQRCRRMQGK